MKGKGLFITFEGIDGCGKTTQIELLKDYYEKQGKTVVLTREPGAEGLGAKLREILLNYDGAISSVCEAFLFLADRAQNIDTIIRPAVMRGDIVLCDRHIDSTLAYQGYGRKLDIDEIRMLNNIATSGYKPDITFVLDIDINTAQSRLGSNRDRMEAAGIDFFRRVRAGYLEIAKNEPERVKIIDGTKSVRDVRDALIKYLIID